jgi:hypothetical protein
MSQMLMDLVGKCCVIQSEDEEYFTGSAEITCRVLAVDSEWIKLVYPDGRGGRICRLERVENVRSVLVYND